MAAARGVSGPANAKQVQCVEMVSHTLLTFARYKLEEEAAGTLQGGASVIQNDEKCCYSTPV